MHDACSYVLRCGLYSSSLSILGGGGGGGGGASPLTFEKFNDTLHTLNLLYIGSQCTLIIHVGIHMPMLYEGQWHFYRSSTYSSL